jgi:hypothetical protein
MADSDLYFGPYNDPGDIHTRYHWSDSHDPDFHNPAFLIDRTGQTLSIVLALRNRRIATPAGVTVNLYAAACGLFSTIADANTLVGRVLANGSQNPLTNPDLVSTYLQEWSALKGNAPDNNIPPYSSASDTPWLSETITWPIPAFSNSYVLVATVSCTSYGVGPDPADAYTQDPCVAVWLG